MTRVVWHDGDDAIAAWAGARGAVTATAPIRVLAGRWSPSDAGSPRTAPPRWCSPGTTDPPSASRAEPAHADPSHTRRLLVERGWQTGQQTEDLAAAYVSHPVDSRPAIAVPSLKLLRSRARSSSTALG